MEDVAAGPPLNLTCVICLGMYDDPCFCSDGWTYCRLCIARWAHAGSPYAEGKWKSPHTNEMIPMPAIIRPNEELGVLVLEEKKRQLTEKMQGGLDNPRAALHAAASICEKGRSVCVASVHKQELFQLFEQINWKDLSKPEASRCFAEALSMVHKMQVSCLDIADALPDPLERLLECAGAEAPRALVQREADAIGQPLLRLGVLKDMLGAVIMVCTRRGRSREWLRMMQELLRHVTSREEMVDSITISNKCFTRNQSKCAGVYTRCDRQWACPPGTERFVCNKTGAFLDVHLWPSAAYGQLEKNTTTHTGTAVVRPADERPVAIFRSHMRIISGEAGWEMRRIMERPTFPDYDPRWSECAENWPTWGDEETLGIFEALPEELPEGFEYRSCEPLIDDVTRKEDELHYYRSVNDMLFADAIEKSPKRRRR